MGRLLVFGDSVGEDLTISAPAMTSYYLSPAGLVDVGLSASSTAGGAALVNVPPGTLDVGFDHGTRTCHAPFTPGASADSVTVTIQADATTLLYLHCEQ